MPSWPIDMPLVRRGPALVVVAHPDDEAVGFSSLLAGWPEEVELIVVTDGAPREGSDARRLGYTSPATYADVRASELRDAIAASGARARLTRLEVPDQGAAHRLPAIVEALIPEVHRAALIATHAFEGGHPDHDASAFCVQRALELSASGALRLEAPFYRLGDGGDPKVQRFVELAGAGPEIVLVLDPAQREIKERMLAAHRSQRDVLAMFSRAEERFRVAPPYDFAVLPNQGRLFYERHRWGLDGAQWLRLAKRALGPATPESSRCA